MKKKNVVVLSHSVFVNNREDVFGPGHSIRNLLKVQKIPYTYIRHSLYSAASSIVEEFDGKKTSMKSLTLSGKLPGHLRYPLETISIVRYMAKRKKTSLIIGINPLNALTGILIKKIGKADSVVFYTADYAYERFKNSVLNKIYHMLDREALKNVDSVWNVSSRIHKVRSKQNIASKKNILVPNTPMFNAISNSRKDDVKRDSLVLTANFTPAIDYELIVHAVAELKKRFPEILLSFIGSGEKEKKIKKLVKKLHLSRNVVFLGYKPREEVIEIVSNHAVGLAIYAKEWPWVEFGDSMKAREYLALGLPVIITKSVSTGDDIERYQAGFSINLRRQELVASITILLSDDKVYNSMKKNALKLAKDYDFEKILNKHLVKKYLL